MKILKDAGKFEILAIMGGDGESAIKLIEDAGRTAYRTEEKISDDSARAFVKMIRNRGHEAVIEHSCMTVRFDDVCRGFCYDDQTEVLTDSGWKLFRDVTEGDTFFTMNMDTREPEYQKRTDYTEEDWVGSLLYGQSTWWISQ